MVKCGAQEHPSPSSALPGATQEFLSLNTGTLKAFKGPGCKLTLKSNPWSSQLREAFISQVLSQKIAVFLLTEL